MAPKPFCECEAQFCPHRAAGCSNPPVGKADVMTFHMNLCNDCFKRHSEYSPGDVSWVKLGIHSSQKEAMITSDTQLENLQEVPTGEAPKDDLEVNAHPADGESGAPVLDGELHHTERPNVNAMREAIETQDEMEVGKPVDVKQEEVKEEAAKEVSVEKGGGTQIIINIAGKKKTMNFSNRATASAFIKGASAKFGNKFKLVAAEVVTLKPGDHISWHLHQLSNESRYGTVIDVLPQNDDNLVIFDAKQEDIMGHEKEGEVWGYMGLIWQINGQQVKPINPEAAEFEVVQSNSPQQDVDNNKPTTSGMSDIDGGAPSFKGASGGEKNYAIYTGPTIVKQVADKLQASGVEVLLHGTSHVHVLTNKSVEELLGILGPTWKPRDIQELPRRPQDDEYLRKSKGAASLPSEEYKACTRIERELHVPYSEVVEAFLQFPNLPLNERAEHARGKLLEEAAMQKSAGFNFSPSNVPSQVVQEFYPELQHELISYPNVTNAPMVNPEISGDAHELGTAPAEGIGEATLIMNNEDELLPGAIEDAFEGMNRIGYISTSPAGGAGIGRDGKTVPLEGVELMKPDDIRTPGFMEEFYAQYDGGIPGNALAISASATLSKKVAAAEEKQQFSLFLKRVMGEVAASFIAAFKVTSKMPMNKVPGVGEIQLAQVEQPQNLSTFNMVNTGSRVKYLMDKLTDSEIQDAINDAYAQGAVWHEGKEGGFVYEVFVRAETIDTESMLLKYKFVTGTKEAE